MKIYTSITLNIETLKVLSSSSYEYKGPLDLACGPSTAMKTAAAQQESTAGMMNKDFQTIFGTNTNILDSISDALTPVVEKGPGQYGFTDAEDAAIRTQATAANASASQQATNAVRSAQAARGGGNMLIPSGSEAAIEGALAESQAQKQADTQLGITQKGFDTGRENFFNAESRLASAPGFLENPITSSGEAAIGAGKDAYDAASQIQQAQNAWIAPTLGLAGAVLGGPIGAGIGKKVGGAVAGGGSGQNDGSDGGYG